MLPSTAVIKRTAKTILKGNMLRCVVAVSVAVAIYFATSLTVGVSAVFLGNFMATVLQNLLLIFLLLPLFLGVLRFFRRLQWGVKDDVISIFHYFSAANIYTRALKFLIAVWARILLRTVLLMIVPTLLQVMSNTDFYGSLGIQMPVWASDLWMVAKFVRIISTVLIMIYALRFYMAPFLYVADEDMHYAEALHLSKMISKRTALEFVYLGLSLIVWIILSVFAVGLVLTLPLLILCYLVHCRFAVAQYNATVSIAYSEPFYSTEI